MISLSMVMQFLGGLGLFLYGVNTTSQGLQKIAANKLKNILESLTRRTWAATLFGIVMTVALQSSAATTVIVVEFVNSGLMTLTQALGIALGSIIGTSIVIQLISFPILDIALLFIFIGFIFLLILRTQWTKLVGQALIGFGCIFVGMAYLSGAFAPMRNSPQVSEFLSQFGLNPILGIFISVLLTALIQSSAAYLAILISLSSQGLLTIEAIVPLVLGAHIGGTITTLISSLGAERIDAKRLAIANSIFRIVPVLILFAFLPYFEKLVEWSAEDLPRQVANTHLFSAILMVITFLPLNRILAQVLVKLIPQRKEKDLELRTKYITKEALEVPTVALSQAGQEIHWLGHNILDNMLQILPRALSTGDARWISELEKAEQRVDWHYAQLHNFLKELFGGNMTRQQIVENHNLQLIAKELESIADCLVTMARLAQKIHIGKIFVARKEWVLLEELYLVVADNYLALLRLFDSKEPAIAIRINEAHSGIIEAYNRLQGDIVCRIQEDDNDKDWKENLSAGQNAIIELGNLFYKIGEHIASIVKVMS